ncbi:MAG: response regulator [Chloroflexi bacterium]|nr:response regulator [Chloroflexota bacterium]
MNDSVRILHLEDDAADAELVQAKLDASQLNYTITRVQSRDQFNLALRTGGFDVILADYQLPEYDGMSALRLTLELCPQVPFVFVSGVIGEDAAIEALVEGATDYVFKQKLSRLAPAITRALREAENRRERKKAEQEITNLARFPEENPNPVMRTTFDGRLVYANTASQMLLKDWACQVGDHLPASVQTRIVDALTGRAKIIVEISCGELVYSLMIVPIENAGYVNLYGREITESKRAEQALRKQYSTLHSLIESGTALIFSVDRQYRYTNFNTGHARVMKLIYGADIEVGHSLLDYMTVEQDRETAKRNLDRALAGEQLVEEAYSGEEYKSRRYFQVSHGPIKSDDEIIGVAVLSQDMTERRQAEEKIKQQLDELLRWQDITLNREGRIQELKLEVNQLCERLDEARRYSVTEPS